MLILELIYRGTVSQNIRHCFKADGLLTEPCLMCVWQFMSSNYLFSVLFSFPLYPSLSWSPAHHLFSFCRFGRKKRWTITENIFDSTVSLALRSLTHAFPTCIHTFRIFRPVSAIFTSCLPVSIIFMIFLPVSTTYSRFSYLYQLHISYIATSICHIWTQCMTKN